MKLLLADGIIGTYSVSIEIERRMRKNMAIVISEKRNCTACAACSNICPKGCITMTEDEMGFQYPVVDYMACIECQLCEKRCPVLHPDRPNHNDNPTTYAARTKNPNLRFCSTSGGIFSELAACVCEQGGAVCGARYDSDQCVEHFLIEDIKDIETIRQSKYMQSRIGYVYQDIKKQLQSKRLVAFCGTPCQVAGLYQYLGHDDQNLLTFDFICRGVNSPKAFQYWLKEIEDENHSKATRIWFKYKQNGWKASPRCTRVDFSNGQFKVYSGEENTFMCGYLGPNLYIRPSCGECRFKGTPRLGDITLADFWGLDSVLEDDGGTSLVLVNSPKGERLFEMLHDRIEYEKHDFSEIAAGNVCETGSVTIHSNSEAFLKSLGSAPFSKLVRKYSKPSLSVRVTRKAKKIGKKIIRAKKKFVQIG